MTTRLTKVGTLAYSILRTIGGLKAVRIKFMVFIFVHWLCVRGRYNFHNMARYGHISEKTLRSHFAAYFPWLDFNVALTRKYLSDDRIIAFDPTYISKSGKKTAGVGYFWSGQAGAVKWGMEFGGLAAVDLKDKTAMHLLALQTTDLQAGETLPEFYASLIELNAEALKKVSDQVVVDAYFSRFTYIDPVVKSGFSVTSRLRKDAHLRYYYTGPRRGGKGRPKEFDGKVDPRQLRPDVFTPCATAEDGSWCAFQGAVEVRSLKRKCRVVITHDYDEHKNIKSHRIHFSTKQSLDGGEVLHMYQSRYQQEFLFRDAKQELGLEECQAYCTDKNEFHVNCALTVGSLAKAAHHLHTNPHTFAQGSFSIADVKTEYFNENQALRILSTCGIDANLEKIKSALRKIKNFGKRRA